MSILTFKIKHDFDFSLQLKQARKVAEYSIKNRKNLSTKYVKHIGLTASIANQVLRKYGRNKKTKEIRNIKLVIANYFIKLNKENKEIYIPSLKARFNYCFEQEFEKINQIEIDNEYFYIAVQIKDKPAIKTNGCLGIDRNTTGHCVVAACDKTGRVVMLGKSAKHIHTKYERTRKKLQKLGKTKKLKQIKTRETNIIKDLNHKISRKVVNYASDNNLEIKLENLKGIRKNKKQKQSFRYALNSWCYYQLQLFIEYKAQLLGVPVFYVNPAFTSQTCSKCGIMGQRNGKKFKCPCGHASHADVNAAWNVCFAEKLLEGPKIVHSPLAQVCLLQSKRPYIQQLQEERDFCKGNTDVPQGALR